MPDGSVEFSPWDCPVAPMVAFSVSEGDIRTTELVTMDQIASHPPVLAADDVGRVNPVSVRVIAVFPNGEALDRILGEVRRMLPERLFGAACALCPEVAAVGELREAESRKASGSSPPTRH